MRGGSGVKLFWGAMLAAALIALVALGGGVWLLARFQNAADYPGAARMAGQNIYSVWPYPTVRRDTSYLTGAPFPDVYNFYSSGFSLGPELYAESNCIQMARNYTELYVVERSMSVTLCDTPKGRMIFVMRSMTLRLPR